MAEATHWKSWEGLVQRAAGLFGLEIKRQRRDGWHPVSLGKAGLAPRTIVDVGAGVGTPALYEAFGQAFLVLVDPLVEHVSALQRALAGREGSLVQVAAGSAEGSLDLRVEMGDLLRSSAHRRTGLTASETPLELRSVPVKTLDGLLEGLGLEGPFLIKLDTEGHELEVLRGATATLGATQAIIAELSVASRFEGGYSFAEAIEWLDRRGFRLSDILRVQRAEATRETLFLDALFVAHELAEGPSGGSAP